MTRITILAILAAASTAFAQYNTNSCGPHTTVGTYAVTCTGFITPGPNMALVPFTILGTVSSDSSGFFSGIATNSVGGTIFPQPVSGQASTAPDCTGTITYNKGARDEINIKYVVLANGDEMRGMVTDRGANISCTLTRMKR